ncbi:hypothetical protein OIU76_017208 [Salix suchowensis]|nr:hypothetical protein OIU76_017208 [Salix suchowensis]KAJ6341015.1 hypothetical protein OIU78_009234 [Salix suchowensis]
MSVSKLTKKDCMSDVSCRFIQLPDELTVTILKKTGDPKTLICCSAVCKHLQCVVSKADSVALRFSYPGTAGEYLQCWNSHHHIPQPAIPSLMKVFANLISLKIDLCLCPELVPLYSGIARTHGFKFQLKSVDMTDKMHTEVCLAFEVGLLSSDDEGMLLSEAEAEALHILNVKSPLTLSFFLLILCYRPKSLRSVVILSSGLLGYGIERYLPRHKVMYRSGGNVFMESEQLAKFRSLNSTTGLDESWLTHPQNLICWRKKHEEDEYRIGERLWLVHKWEGERCNMKQSVVKKTDVDELLRAFDEDADEQP